MIPSKELINGLRKTSYELDNFHIDYNWNNCSHCNCAFLIKNLLNVKSVYSFTYVERCMIGSWSDSYKHEYSKFPIFSILSEKFGFTYEDFLLIEYAGETKPLLSYPNCETYSNREFVAKFMEDLANKLENELRIKELQFVKTTQKTVQNQSVGAQL